MCRSCVAVSYFVNVQFITLTDFGSGHVKILLQLIISAIVVGKLEFDMAGMEFCATLQNPPKSITKFQ